VTDGKAGPVTQRYLTLDRIHPVTSFFGLPQGLLRGIINQESAFLVGNHTGVYSNGKRDLGLCQHNSYPNAAECQLWFDGRWSIQFLAGDSERGLRPRKDKYYGRPGAQTHQRAWELAAGSWHTPSWADTLASGGNLGPVAKEHFDNYVAKVTTYVKKWNE
jgi:hypothetical protein